MRRRLSIRLTGWMRMLQERRELDRRLFEANFLAEATQLLAFADLQVALERVARLAVPLLGDAVAIDLIEDAAARRVLALGDGGEPPAHLPEPDVALHLACAGQVAAVRRSERACLVAPLWIAGEVGGALSFAARARDGWTAADRRLAAELGQRTGSAIERARTIERVRAALEARGALLSIAAHEIRGPANTIHLAVQTLLEEEATSPVTSRMLDVIDRADRRLRCLLEGLMDVGRIHTGRITLELEPVDLRREVTEVVARMAADVQHSGSTIVLNADQAVIGEWDRFRIDQIVSNLVTNALKFGRGRPVEITVESAGDQAQLIVRDHGRGIAPEVADRLFQPFEHGGGSPGGVSSFGLGLYIVKTNVQNMGGAVSAAAADGGGARFEVMLPRRIRPAA
jgi:signal transduction histidine kinase